MTGNQMNTGLRDSPGRFFLLKIIEEFITILFSQYLLSRYLRTGAMLLVLGILTGLFAGGVHPVAANLIPSPWDKLAHAVIFALLTWAIGTASGLSGWRRLGLAFLGAALIGLFDEWHQMYLPGRKAGWDDFVADVTGSLIGIALLEAEWRHRN
jgi:hypothetical protein